MSCGSQRPAPGARTEPALPPASGELTVSGLSQPVRILRDRWGVPHITAQNQHDLFFAQGFVQAQDRLFQIDLWRRSVQGRLSQVLGPNYIDRDAMTRRIQYRGDPAAEWASYGDDAHAIAEAFVSGINAWVVRARANPPDEFALAGWKPELWQPEDLLNRTDAFLASGDASLEAFRAQLAGAVGETRARMLAPGALPRGLRSDLDVSKIGDVLNDALRRVGTAPFFLTFAARAGGSNAWAVAGSRTSTGAPLLASDPHRPLANPALRYLVHLKAPGWDVIGATSPWLPGVAMGHNDRVAWGAAAFPVDTQDLFIEPAAAIVDRVSDPIYVKGEKKPVAFVREYTKTGVVIASDRQHGLVFTLRWKGFGAGGAAELHALGLDRAAGLADFRAAIGRWTFPAVEFVYADAREIGQQLSGETQPARGGSFVSAANDNRARFARLDQLLGGAGRYSIDDIKRQQHDVTAWNAQQLLPRLTRLRSKDARVEQARQELLTWDRQVTADSPAAALYVAFERALWRKIAETRVPALVLDDYVGKTDFDAGDAKDATNAMVLDALAIAAAASRQEPREVTFKHPLAISQATRKRFNVGPFAIGGYADTVMAVYRRADVDIGPSFRQILDVADWDRSVATNAPGQSEWSRSPHFADLAKLWGSGEYFPLVFSEGAIQKSAESTLTLLPR